MSETQFWAVGLTFTAAILLSQWWLGQRAKAKQRAAEQAEQAEKDEFWKSAKCVHAKVLSTGQIGQYNLRPLFMMNLRVEAPEGAYDVSVEHAVDLMDLQRFREGSMIDVYVDPNNRERVRIR